MLQPKKKSHMMFFRFDALTVSLLTALFSVVVKLLEQHYTKLNFIFIFPNQAATSKVSSGYLMIFIQCQLPCVTFKGISKERKRRHDNGSVITT